MITTDRTSTNDPIPVGADAPILAVMSSMQAMRRLRPDPVPDELLRQLVQAATWAGSGSYLEGYSFIAHCQFDANMTTDYSHWSDVDE